MNKNGFMLSDVLAAATVSILFLVPVLALTAQSVSLYRQARYSMDAAAIGRNTMEEIRQQPYRLVPYEQACDWNGISYTVTVYIVPVADEYWRYDVVVQGDDGIRHEFHRLERREKN